MITVITDTNGAGSPVNITVSISLLPLDTLGARNTSHTGGSLAPFLPLPSHFHTRSLEVSPPPVLVCIQEAAQLAPPRHV